MVDVKGLPLIIPPLVVMACDSKKNYCSLSVMKENILLNQDALHFIPLLWWDAHAAYSVNLSVRLLTKTYISTKNLKHYLVSVSAFLLSFMIFSFGLALGSYHF